MKKTLKIILAVLLVLILAAAGVCIWQWNNISALKLSMSTSRDDLNVMISENLQKVNDTVQKVDGVSVRDLTDEERELLRREELTHQELLERLTEKKGEETAESNTEPLPEIKDEEPTFSNTAPISETVEEEAADPKAEQLSNYLAEIYLMKEEYTIWLEEKYNAAITEYTDLPEEERTTSAKYAIGIRYMKEALEKETECDQRMEDLLVEIQTLLTEMGQDTAMVEEIRSAYAEEKELKKAYYLGLHS